MSKQVNNTVAVLTFFNQQKREAQLPAIITTEEPILLTKRKINRPGYKIPKYFLLKRAVKSRTRSLPGTRI